MEFMTCIVSADEDEYSDLAASASPLHEWSGIESPGLDTARLAALHSLLTGDPLHVAMDYCEPVCVVEGDNETLILRIDTSLADALVELDEEALETVAAELAATEAFEGNENGEEGVFELLTALAELAQLAESQGQLLFVWIRIVQD
ncbi:hypothetical protein HCX48_01210 [Rhodocyclus tenuis]|uniref:DUF1877 family protein n=2 Tax=Rhodocyclus TaxID=1064 RepID=A0A6L5JTI4_RHOTE|nr:hypothetical protein [Rhodocyclus gracilis]MQY50341.1 hypothetical protein [Rhodocyclus gracilis]NJA87844.1 hypothetical protein [Rhodocyclus gracilis]